MLDGRSTAGAAYHESMRLLLIRHGQTPHNVTGALDTAFPGAGLTDLGRRQAEAVPGVLEGDGVAGIYASRLVRTQLTATPLARARGMDVAIEEGLEEIQAGDFELRNDTEAILGYVHTVAGWIEGDLGRTMPGGHDGHEFLGRYQGALTRIAQAHASDDLVAVFSHGAAIRVFTALAVGLSTEQAKDLHIANTGASLLQGHPDRGWELRHWVSDPLGGADLLDVTAHDITGESTEEAEAEAVERH